MTGMTEAEITKWEQELLLEDYLKEGGLLKKDCWLKPMHVRYNPNTEGIELLDSVSTSSGERILGVREQFKYIEDIPYAGKWVKCNERGELL